MIFEATNLLAGGIATIIIAIFLTWICRGGTNEPQT